MDGGGGGGDYQWMFLKEYCEVGKCVFVFEVFFIEWKKERFVWKIIGI